ncbi:monovalent cation/H(+) antiporter subunit G [Rothia terrae]|jgi:multicomponent Na+:H+ antiporter subunit G|uniref:Monovalent cation/H(+) antiporter subunit G n=1 Tax=Rothia terrae TaxID=396015 RepID=A0A7H2BE48_9MICC|nr:monovalent cation/H(+) antiporter subunit G [Rothia terrae]MDT0189309.1 monovalent cation/H(+) antiporter subunit G [Rothia terrae]NKZ33973.1 monovalent cation/H(+) antiporter subunit G [Rothia terrae]QNV37944.1 monovalent cation/H(+) antiporter subunit G [Rothia terrae]
MIDIIAALCMIIGCLMSLAAAAGLYRFPDLLTRLHAGSKPQVFGLMMLLLGIALDAGTWKVVPVLLVALILQFLTIPISTHMMARSGYRNKHFRRQDLVRDDLRARVEDELETEQREGVPAEERMPHQQGGRA